MFKTLKNNPILLHQMRNARWPSLRTAWLIAAALTVIGLALTVTAYAISPGGEKGWVLIAPGSIFLFGSLMMIFGPLLTAVVTMVVTVRAIGSENYQMMRLSQLSERDIVRGYLASAMFRLRSLWMVVGGFVLPLVASVTHIGVYLEVMYTCDLNVNLMQMDSRCIPPQPSEVIIEQIGTGFAVTASYMALFVAWNWLAITLGLWMAFRHRHMGKALVWTLLPLVFAIVLSVVMFFTFGWPFLAVCLVVVIGLPLAFAAYQQAVRCARSTTE